jgi:isopenicillin-N epimerase
MELGAAMRERFALDPGIAFLNHGSFGATPRAVLAAQQHWRERLERDPVTFLSWDLRELLPAAIRALAGFVGAREEHLVLVDNATTAVNSVLRSLPLAPGDEVVTIDHVYASVQHALEFLCGQAGATLRLVRVPVPVQGPDDFVQAFAGALTERTRLALVDHITSPTALICPVREIIDLCHARGVPVLVDGAHGPGMLELDLESLGADWYAGNCHKWLLAPKGCGFLWAAPHRQAELHPPVVSYFHGQGFQREFGWTGTRDPSAWLSVHAALDFLEELGFERVRTHNRRLAWDGASCLARAWGLEPLAPREMLGAMVTLPTPRPLPPTIEDCDVASVRLREEHGIVVPIYPFQERTWVRISAQVYNDQSQYEALARALPQVLDTLPAADLPR